MFETLETTWAPRMLSVLRVVSALIFMEHGTQKWLNFPALNRPGPELASMSGAGGVIELVGGALLVLGLFTRPVAFILSGEMAFAYFMGHAPSGNVHMPMLNRGELAIEWCFVFLFFAAAGAGAWSVDSLRRPTAAA